MPRVKTLSFVAEFPLQTTAADDKTACALLPQCLLIGDHLGSHDTQTTSLRAFRAAEQYGFGKRGRPRFKSLSRLNSIEGKADAVIRYRAEPVPAVHYSGLVLPLMLDPKDKRDWQREALAARTKYV